MSSEFRRWSRWYPASWCADKGAAMLGVYLDQAESEGRDRLTRSEKAGLALGGVGARLDAVIPASARDLAATAMVSLLGAFGLIAGVLLEWAPGNPGPHVSSRILAGTGLALYPALGPSEPRAFGPFVSPFVIVCALAVAAWVLSMVGPERLYRWALVATAVTGLAAGVNGVPRSAWGWSSDYAMIGLFVAVVALLALSAARPRPAWQAAWATLWGCVLLIPFARDVGVTSFIQQYREGSATWAGLLLESPFWSTPLVTGGVAPVPRDSQNGAFVQFGVVPVMMLAIALVLVGALALAFTGRRTLAAASVLATVPWAVYLAVGLAVALAENPVLTSLGESAEDIAAERRIGYLSSGLDLLLLVVLYAAAIAVAVHFRRRSRTVTPADGTPSPAAP